MTEEVNNSKYFNSHNKTWRGTSIKEICRGKGHWSFGVTPLVPSKYHCILYNLPVTLQSPPNPYNTKDVHLWDDDHVRMPYSEKNLFSLNVNKSDVIKERWKIITEVLSQPIKNSYELEAALNKYNSMLPKLDALHYFFEEEMDREESDHFFTNLLPKIIDLALKLPELLPCGIPLLKQNRNRSISISQLQISCLLANAFLCTFPWKKSTALTYPGVNFVSLFSAFCRPKRKQCICEKIKSICNYFRRVTNNVPVGVVTFERKIIPRSSMPRWDTLENNLGNTKVHINSEGTIEDNGLGFLQVDFANKNIGGGVLKYGCVQEEIRFVICPELIVSRLFVEQLGNGESVIITGAERYSDYTGYGDSFEWTGNHQDDTPFDPYGRRRTTICVIDATRFNRPKDQFQGSLMIRELNKAYVGFCSREKDNLAPVATGNWGCGAFKGSKQLKALLQLMACSASNRDLVYYSFGDDELMENFYNIYLFLGNNKVTIAQLWKILNQFSSRNLDENQLYAFIQQAFFDIKKQPTISHFFAKANGGGSKEKSLSGPSTSENKLNTKPQKCQNKANIGEDNMDIIDETPPSTPSSVDIFPPSPPERVPLRKFIKPKLRKPSSDVVSKLPKTDLCEIFDALDGNGNQSKNNTDSKPNTKPQKSPNKDYIDEDNMNIIDETPPSTPSSEEIFPLSPPVPLRKFIKPKLRKPSSDVVSKLPKTDLCEIFEALDGNGNQSKNNTDSKPNTNPQKSPNKDYIDEDNMDIIDETPPSTPSSEEIFPVSPPVPLRKFIKPKLRKPFSDVVSKLPKTDLCEIVDALDGNGNV